ncbi:MAG: Xaa-Pro peptidase family protein [Planctomycetota bacterium]
MSPIPTVEIPEEEFRSRVSRVRDFLASNGLGAALVYSEPWGHYWGQMGHVGYLSNFATRDRNVHSLVVVTVKDDPVFLFAGLPYLFGILKEFSWIRDVRNVAPVDPRAAALPGGPTDFGREVRAILEKRDLADASIALLGADQMPLSLWKVLIASLPAERFVFPRDVVADLRAVKSPREILLLRAAAELCDLGYQTLTAAARPGVRGYEVVAEMERTVRREGADFVKYWFISGPAQNWNDTWPVVRPHSRKLEKGDQIICGSYVAWKGYWAHGMRNGTIGRSPQHDSYAKVAMSIHRAALAAFRPGAPAADVVKAAIRTGRSHNFDLASPRIGHGIGLDYAEKPFMTDTNTDLLAPGMVAVIHSQLKLPDSGAFIVPLGDVCLVTDTGMELLCKFPMESFRL